MGEQLKDLRERLKWSQTQLAAELGVAQSTICRLENGQEPTKPVAKLIEALRKRHARVLA